MDTRAKFRRSAVATAMIVILGLMSACSGGVDGVVLSGIEAAFTPSGTSPAAEGVRLRGGESAGDMVTVEVAIAGPTSDDDYYGFSFDLLLSDPTVARYVSDTAVFGSALTLGGDQDPSVLVSQIGDRVVVGVSKTGGGPDSGNGIGATEEVVLSLVFRVLEPGATEVTIVGSPANPQNPTAEPAALRFNKTVIDDVTFDVIAATISGS